MNATAQEPRRAAVAEGISAFEHGDKSRAKVLLQQALKIDRRNVDAHTYLGMIAADANELNQAEQHFAAAASLAPSDPSTRNNYGAILMRLGRTEQARTEFEASLKLNANQPSALTNLAQIYFDRGEPDDLRMARSFLERAGKSTSDPQISRALVIARLKLGQVLIEKGYLDEAIAELSTALASDPRNADVVVNLSRAQLLKKDFHAAGRTLESAVASGLDDAKIYAALAEVYAADGHFENAIPAMRLAVLHDPHNEVYHFRYGLLLADSHASGAGIVRLQEALKEFPNSTRLWLALGIAQLTYGQNAEAENSFRRSLQLDAKLVPALAYLGLIYSERGLNEKAIGFYEQAIALNSQLAALYYLAADTMLKTSNPDTARVEKYLRRAIELDPNLAGAYVTWGRLYVRAGRYSEAVPLFERAVSLQPELVEAHYQLGRILTKLKRTDEANRELGIFKQLSEKQKAQNEPREIVRRLANVRF
ncbi:MAG TPA: tetratricopeptide repeat protein [Pyrinomonadaceae bacterium]|nr:tetratricopeptide repeat protein [Pyrinomonadaceae bacterium]